MTGSEERVDAFDLRQANFPDVMDFYAPGLRRWRSSEWVPGPQPRLTAVSVTGRACSLSCEHCGAKLLDHMVNVPAHRDLYALALDLRARGCEGLLVSGGSSRSGEVPLRRHLGQIARVRQDLGMRVAVHPGLVSRRTAEELAAAGVDSVMVDVIGADETLRDVYHLDVGVDAVEESLGMLVDAGLRVIPHIVLGLHYGRLLGERRALEMVARHSLPTLVLVVLTPLAGTAMADAPPPELEELAALFCEARLVLPLATVNLGCARPGGPGKLKLDQAAIDSGLNGIAFPADGAIAYAAGRGLRPRLHEYCCSQDWAVEGETVRPMLETVS